MYFIIAPFILTGLVLKLINNKKEKNKLNNQFSFLIEEKNSLNLILNKFKNKITEEADTNGTDRYKYEHFNK